MSMRIGMIFMAAASFGLWRGSVEAAAFVVSALGWLDMLVFDLVDRLRIGVRK